MANELNLLMKDKVLQSKLEFMGITPWVLDPEEPPTSKIDFDAVDYQSLIY